MPSIWHRRLPGSKPGFQTDPLPENLMPRFFALGLASYMLNGKQGVNSMQTEWQSEEIWRKALWTAREQLRKFERDGRDAKSISQQRSTIERIRAAGLPRWQEREEFAGFSFPPN